MRRPASRGSEEGGGGEARGVLVVAGEETTGRGGEETKTRVGAEEGETRAVGRERGRENKDALLAKRVEIGLGLGGEGDAGRERKRETAVFRGGEEGTPALEHAREVGGEKPADGGNKEESSDGRLVHGSPRERTALGVGKVHPARAVGGGEQRTSGGAGEKRGGKDGRGKTKHGGEVKGHHVEHGHSAVRRARGEPETVERNTKTRNGGEMSTKHPKEHVRKKKRKKQEEAHLTNSMPCVFFFQNLTRPSTLAVMTKAALVDTATRTTWSACSSDCS